MKLEDPNYRLLMDYAMRALSQRAHTVHELRTKLKKRPQHKKALEDQIINRLLELKLLDDEAFIRRRIEQAINFRYEGQFKVAQKLFLKGIPLDDSRRIWSEMKINEREVAEKALKKANKRINRAPLKKQYSKRAQFLASRGFSPDIVIELAKSELIP